MSSACTRRYKITIKFWERQIISVPDQFQKFECYILVSIRYSYPFKVCSVSKHKRLDITCDQKLTNEILIGKVTGFMPRIWTPSNMDGWQSSATIGWTQVSGQSSEKKILIPRGPRTISTTVSKGWGGTWVEGCVSTWVHVIPLTNWSSLKQSEASQSLPPTLLNQ